MTLPLAPRVSVVVPVFNDESHIDGLIRSLLDQSFEGYEIIMVDDNSTDGSYEKLRRYAEGGSIRLLRSPTNRGSGFCRNLGVREAKGDVVAFTDSDCVAERDWLSKITRPVLEGGLDAAMGPNHIPLRDLRGCRLESVRAKQYWGMDTKNMAVKRKVVLELGGFNETIKVNVDAEFHRRFVSSGFRVVLTDAKVLHDFPDDAISLVVKARRRGREEAKILQGRRGPRRALRLVAGRALDKLRKVKSVYLSGSGFSERLAMAIYYLSFHAFWNGALLIRLLLPFRTEKG